MKKKVTIYVLMITTELICTFSRPLIARTEKVVETPLFNQQSLSFSSPIVFNKETLKTQALINPHRTPVNTNLTKTERKQIRKQFETLVHHKDAKTLSCEELRQAIDFCLQLEWNEKALLYLQEFLQKTKDASLIESLKLEIADLLFQMGKLIEAEQGFDQYLDLYPGSQYAEYAHYKRTICLFYQTLKTDQDQGPTRKAIQLAESYLEKGLAYKQYRSQIIDIRKQCQLMLFENEKTVFDFYMKRKSYGAANGRLAYLKQQYLQELPHVEPTIIQLECRLAQAQGNTQLYQERLAHLQQKFPEYNKTVKVAQKSSKSYSTKF